MPFRCASDFLGRSGEAGRVARFGALGFAFAFVLVFAMTVFARGARLRDGDLRVDRVFRGAMWISWVEAVATLKNRAASGKAHGRQIDGTGRHW